MQQCKARNLLEQTFIHAPIAPEGNGVKRALYVLLAAGAGYLAWIYASTIGDAPRNAVEAPLVDDRPERLIRARQAMQSYAEAKTIPEKIKHILNPERAAPLMKEYYGDWNASDPVIPWENLESKQPQTIGGRYWLTFKFAQGADAATVEMSLQETPEGYKIDWEKFVALGAQPWGSFCEQRPVSPTRMRASLSIPKGPAPAYPRDGDAFDCYRLQHPSGGVKLLGYAARTDRVAQDLQALLTGPDDSTVVNLYLRFEAGTAPDQVRIIDLAPEVSR